jgi:hypothetical protein
MSFKYKEANNFLWIITDLNKYYPIRQGVIVTIATLLP